ncbi:MAG: hypothetical protein NWF03_06450, partial [Candidatus Bathyarchaeota archaeon]|nr:hypothetical protein [Candidatus Bathyarchaeota archaeon]
MNGALERIVERYGKWRLAFVAFLVVYAIILLMYLDYAPIQWDETPHLSGPVILNQGRLFIDYLEVYAFYPP